jgi:hypothetical protein
MAINPYTKLPAQAYWRTGVARHSGKGKVIPNLWTPSTGLDGTERYLTVGSCFAQHIGKALDAAGLDRMLIENAPSFLSSSMQEQFGYGMFSFRLGNVYTAAMLLQWLRWMQNPTSQDHEIWTDGDAFFDPVRPSIEPGGFETERDLFNARNRTLAAMREGIDQADVFIFTLGLTETWMNANTGLVYASCPGTQAGQFDGEQHKFSNATFSQTMADLVSIRKILKLINPDIRLLLTVSPVPLTATAVPGTHVLVSTVHSKSVLRAAAGEMAYEFDDVEYFPSYEIVSHPSLGMPMFEADRREVTKDAVAFVMKHFLAGLGIDDTKLAANPIDAKSEMLAQKIDEALAEGDAICDEVELDKYNEN